MGPDPDMDPGMGLGMDPGMGLGMGLDLDSVDSSDTRWTPPARRGHAWERTPRR
ncbi:hypothetical protein ACFRNT_00375 [Streptomyces sp. NPDC056697]|uniref:hypothetical protein n=1 Tax=Streptomyces sp. NPDC056697 TaxID=3345915 RepID=UPI0036BE294F